MSNSLFSSPDPHSAIAIVGMACRYPDARSPLELWQNVLAQRQAFRRIPPERLSLDDYFSSDPKTPDAIYSAQAALIENYEFDRVGFRVVGSTFRSADLVHWLALDIAAQALADAGFPNAKKLPRQTTGVLLGNTLTGEFSRANSLRLRWPYVRRVVEAKLVEQGMTRAERLVFLEDLQTQYKKPFPEIGEESLAGNLSNTIAGRICNYFDLKGGGYTIDGACSSSLLAVANACSALVAGDLDVALAGGVDLSLDPFELVGFAKAGALATQEMRVYDARSAGFFPGEGCGFVVLMRYEDALKQHCRIYSVIRGWGISSDGKGGITRPDVEGQLLAIQRAYHRAGLGVDTVSYFEGHGTGTTVGDTTELQALSLARREEMESRGAEGIGGWGDGEIGRTRKNFPIPDSRFPITHYQLPITQAVIGSVKANIGHTKAAAGIAGLIKATMALDTQILPPTTGCQQPHRELMVQEPTLRVLNEGQAWPASTELRASVSAMGFGGINTHLVLEGTTNERRQTLTAQERQLIASPQDAELILFAASNRDQLKQEIEHLLTLAPQLSTAEVGDLAAALARSLDPALPLKAALVATHPQELTSHLQTLNSWLTDASLPAFRLHPSLNIFLGRTPQTPRIGFLFPGQAAPVYLNGGAWERRFPLLKELYTGAALPTGDNPQSTAIAQPAIVTASLAGLQVLGQLGISAALAVGHSLGELVALYYAEAIDRAALVRIAKIRGQAMAQLGSPTGIMASIGADERAVRGLLLEGVTIAGLNSPNQTVISGESKGVNAVIEKAKAKGLQAVTLPVSHAFHSPLVAAATQPLAEQLAKENFQPLQSRVVSTISGSLLDKHEELRSLLLQQVTAPVRFLEAISTAAQDLDLLIEVGPGQILSRLVTGFIDLPVVALDSGGSSLKGLLQAAGIAFALGNPINHHILFKERFTRPFNLNGQPQFFVNPCELAPVAEEVGSREQGRQGDKGDKGDKEVLNLQLDSSLPIAHSLDCIRQLVAQRTELPLEAVKDEHRLLSDLHLNSITVGQLVAQAARSLGVSPPVNLTDYADATIAQIAQALEELAQVPQNVSTEAEKQLPAGVDSWIRTFTVELSEQPLKSESGFGQKVESSKCWRVIAPADYPLAEALQQALNTVLGGGVVVCLPPNPDESHIDLLLTGAHPLLSQTFSQERFILVQQGGGGAAFVRTLYLENPQLTACVVDVPLEHPQAIEWIVAEASRAIGYGEVYYDGEGNRRIPVLRLLPFEQHQSLIPKILSKEDVLVVTGGGKGIAAECALSIAQETGVRLALLGRSQPETDPQLAVNLARITAKGIDVKYLVVDLTDAQAVNQAVREIERDLGAITAILHGAGVNTPKLLKNLTKEDFLATLAPKVQGLRHLLAAIAPDHLKLMLTFGSIIARTGLPGEADYALANEWLGRLVEQFQVNYPHCRCLNI